jgi:hypothetical protein
VEGSCKHGNEGSGSIKCWEVVAASQEELSSMQLVCWCGRYKFDPGLVQSRTGSFNDSGKQGNGYRSNVSIRTRRTPPS